MPDRTAPDPSNGVVVLQGGAPFTANDALDCERLTGAGIDRVVVLPTADAYEQPGELVAAARAWGDRIGVEVEPLMVLVRSEADDGAAAVVRSARAVFLAGDSANHLRSALKDTPLYAAIIDLVDGGGTLIACGASAAALCDPMADQRGGGYALGLGLVQGLAVIPATETWPREQLDRAHSLANTPVVDLPTGSAIVRAGGVWTLVGDAMVHGELA